MATEQVVETAARSLEEAAFMTLQLNVRMIGLVAGGVSAGLVVGFLVGWRFQRAKIRAEAFAQSEEEVEKIREMYRNAAKIQVDEKPTLEEVVEDRGYAVKIEVPDQAERLPRPPVPISPSEAVRASDITRDTAAPAPFPGWDMEEELANRRPDRPYVIHEEEFSENFGDHRQETLTYYAGDAVLADENEDRIDVPDDIIGLDNLTKFGHGSGDPETVFVHNPIRNMDYEITRVPDSYAELVLGLQHDQPE